MYRNLIANPSAKADFIVYQIQKYYNFRVQALTHAQVEEMAAQVQTIADEHHLTDDASTVPEDERRLSKREDHDHFRSTTRPARTASVIRSSKNLYRST